MSLRFCGSYNMKRKVFIVLLLLESIICFGQCARGTGQRHLRLNNPVPLTHSLSLTCATIRKHSIAQCLGRK